MAKKVRNSLLIVAFLLIFFIGNRAGVLFHTTEGNIMERLNHVISNDFFTLPLSVNLQHTSFDTLIFGMVAMFVAIAFYIYNFVFRKNTRHGEEQGSARYATIEESKPFTVKEDRQNVILSQNARLALSNKTLPYKYHTNKNVMVLGGSGSGKTRFYVKPNLLQCHACYVVTDPKGTCLPEVGNALLQDGYKIKWLNTIKLRDSMHFDPLHYARDEQDILTLVDALIISTKRPENTGGEQFWEDAVRLSFVAVMSLVKFHANYEDEKNFATFLDMYQLLDVDEDEDNYVYDDEDEEETGIKGNTPLDIVFRDLAKTEPDCFAVRTYRDFKKAHGKTASSVIITACAMLMPFNIPALREIFSYDEMELDSIGFEKTAHFLMVDDTNKTFDFVVGLFYSVMLTRMIRNADDTRGSLPIPTRMIMDEAANIAQVNNLEKVTGQIRSRNISIDMIYQNPQQLKALYKDKAPAIMGNFDTVLFLGSEEKEAGQLVSDKIGAETVSYQTSSQNRGNNTSYGVSEQLTKRQLLEVSEVRMLPADECITFIKSLPPIRDNKYTLEKHPNFHLTADYSEDNLFIPTVDALETGTEKDVFDFDLPVVDEDYTVGNTRHMEVRF